MKVEYVLWKLTFPQRIAVFAGSAALGVAAQFLIVNWFGSFLGLALMAPAVAVMAAKNYQNKPLDLGFEDWKPASLNELGRIRTNLQQTRKARFPLLYRKGFGTFCTVVLLVLWFFCMAAEDRLLSHLFFDAFFLLIPFFFTGNVRLWTPAELQMKLSCFEAVLKDHQDGGDLIVTPYLRLDKDKEGRQIPEDIRLMLEPRRKPEDFLGVQFQVAINNGANGKVPYMYCVFLCKGKGRTFLKASQLKFQGMEHEPGGDKEYGYVVVRQKTAGGGYHTKDDDCRRLFALARESLEGLKETQA